jgi:hypothetical protein
MSLDLYGTSSNAIAQGNMRAQQVRDLNERIQQHNTDIANQISGLKDTLDQTKRIKEFQQSAQALWTAKGMPNKVKAWNDYFNKPQATNPTTQSERTTRQAIQQREPTTQAPAEASATAEREAVSGADGVAGQVGKEASSLTQGIESAVGKGTNLAGKIGEGAGVLMSAGAGAMDLYQDYEESKKDGHFEIAGNNNWEKAGNILQIGGSIGDVVGTFFPPAKLIGGVLDLASAATDEIGEQLDNKSDKTLDAQQKQETVQQVVAPAAETLVTGRTQ